MKSRRTKKTLISSMVSLVLCLAMLVGSTLAWFTDTISVTADLKVGSLKVALQKYIGDEYKNVGTKDNDANYTESTEPVFGGTNWTPNQTEVYYLAVSNEGKIAFNYDMEITLEGDMTGALEYAIIDGLQAGTPDAEDMDLAVAGKKWDIITAAAGGQTGLVEEGELQAAPYGHLEAGAVDYFALVLHMDENAGNEYQGTYFNADIVVNARQLSYIAPAEDGEEDPLARFKDELVYDFEEDNFAFLAYNNNTDNGVGAYKPSPTTITLGEEGGNHFGRMTRIWAPKPASLSGVAAPRMQFNNLAAAVEDEYIVAVSFDIKNFDDESFASFSLPGLKLHDNVITVCFGDEDTPDVLVDLSDDEWHNVVVVFDRIYGTIQYYGDGVLLEGVEGTFTGTGFSAEGYLRFQIDQWNWPALPTETLVGNNDFGIDNFKIMSAPVEDPFEDYVVEKIYDFENDFALGAYNATTGVGSYNPNKATDNATIEEDGDNHYLYMSRNYAERPAAMPTSPRVQFNEIFTPDVIASDVVVYSFDVMQDVADSFMSLGWANIKLTNDKVSVCLGENEEVHTLVDLSDGEWHNIAIKVDYKNNTTQFYGDFIPCQAIVSAATPARTAGGYLRFQADKWNWPAMDAEDQTNNYGVGIDNFKVMVPPVVDPFEGYVVEKEFDFENEFALGAYNATTGVGYYNPNKTTDAATIEAEEDGNHYVYMSRNYAERPAAMPTSPRIQFNEIFTPGVIAADEVVYSFDVMQGVADSFMSLGFANIKLTNDKVWVCLGEEDEAAVLADLTDGEWHNIAIKVDYANSKTYFYGDWRLSDKVADAAAPTRTAGGYLRMQPDKWNWPAMDEEDQTNNYGVGIDNFKVMIPPVVDPFEDYTVVSQYDFENDFVLGAYNATTGVGSYNPNKTTDSATIEEEDGNHYVYMSRNFAERPATMPSAPRIQFNEIYNAAAVASDVLVYSFDVKQDVADSFMSFGHNNIKLTNDKVWVCLGEDDEAAVLVDLTDGEWHNIAIKVDRANSKTYFYGDWKLSEKVLEAAPAAITETSYLRMQADAFCWPAMDEEDKTNNYGVGIDNFTIMIP